MSAAAGRLSAWGGLPLLLLTLLIVVASVQWWHRAADRAEIKAEIANEDAAVDAVGTVRGDLAALERDTALLRGGVLAPDLAKEITETLQHLSTAEVEAAQTIEALPDFNLHALIDHATVASAQAPRAIGDDLAAVIRLDEGVCSEQLSPACLSFMTENESRLAELSSRVDSTLAERPAQRTLKRDWPTVAQWMQGRLAQQPETGITPDQALLSGLTEAIRRGYIEDMRDRIFDLNQAWGDVTSAAIAFRRHRNS